MPKKRRDETPYDPITAELVREATSPRARSVAPVPPIAQVPSKIRQEPSRVVEPTITKRFVLTRGEDAEVEAFLLRVQRAARAKVPLGVLMRSALAIVMESESVLCAGVEKQSFRLPSTHDRVALGEFEEQWKTCLVRALHGLLGHA
jgi:hypothetical protein